MRDEIDLRQRLVPGVLEQVVEALAAGRALQAVDAAEAAVVEHDDGELHAEHDRGRDLGVHHQVRAVADHDDHLALGPRHLDAEAAGDLVAHAGIAVFEVVAAGLGGAARACAARPAGRRRRRRRYRTARPPRCTAPITCASDGSAAFVAAVAAAASSRQRAFSAAARSAQPRGARRPPSAAESRSSPTLASQTSGSAPCLLGIEALHVEADDRRLRVAEQRPGAGGEILQPRADREHDVGLGRERVRGARAGDADRAHVERMIVRQRALAGLRLGDRNAVRLGEAPQRLGRLGVVHAAAGDDQRFLRAPDERRRVDELALVRPDPPQAPDALGEEALGIVERLRLHVLAQRQRHRPAFGRIGQHRACARGNAVRICSGRVMRSK